jgi:hypothetical protein
MNVSARAFPVYVWLAALILCAPASAGATGTTRVQQLDGTVNLYRGVKLETAGDTLALTSPDGRDRLVLSHAACSFAGALERCLVYKMVLHRAGTVRDIAIERGTLYLNLTSAAQQLPYSSHWMPSHGVLLSIRTAKGTYIAVDGVLDRMVR